LSKGGHVRVDVTPGAVETATTLEDDAPSCITFHFETESRLPIPEIEGVNGKATKEAPKPEPASSN
jgi:hypothetical protein